MLQEMQRLAICCLMMAACGPGAPPVQGGSTTSASDGTSAAASSTSAGPTTDASTTGAPTTDATGPMPVTSTTGDTSSGESTAVEGSSTGEPAPCCVAPDAPTSSLQAETPVGARALPWAVYSVSGGECGGAFFVHLYPEASGVDTQWPELENVDYLKLEVSSYMDMWPNGFIGTGPVWVEAHFDGQFANTEGEITILEFDDDPENIAWCDPEATPVMLDAHVSFTIALKSDGWDIAGEVLANYCPALNQICP